MKKYVIIVAGGSGQRMATGVPKQFTLLKGKPLLYYSIDTFLKAFNDCIILLVLPEEHIATGQEIIDAFFGYERIKIITGGRTRFHSVQNGLAAIPDEDSFIFVHDAARPFVDIPLIARCYDAVSRTGSAIPVINCKDSVRMITEQGNEAVDRDQIKLVQTPQVFHSKIILPAFTIDYKDKFTDEASVAEAFGIKVTLVEGDEKNIKITDRKDFLIAEMMLS